MGPVFLLLCGRGSLLTVSAALSQPTAGSSTVSAALFQPTAAQLYVKNVKAVASSLAAKAHALNASFLVNTGDNFYW